MAAGGTLGILIPPSISFILYGVLVEESIGRLYMAGFIPGFLLTVVFMVIIAVIAKIWPNTAPRETVPSWRVRLVGWNEDTQRCHGCHHWLRLSALFPGAGV